MEQKVKIANIQYFYKYYEDNFKAKLVAYDVKIEEDTLAIKELADYIREHFTEIPTFGRLDFSKLEHTDVAGYITSHGSFYIGNYRERAFLIKLKELQALIAKRASVRVHRVKYEARFVNKQEFNWLLKSSSNLMIKLMIEKGKKYILSTKLGNFVVFRKWADPSRLVVNHPDTKANKQRLLDAGVVLKSPENPNGAEYIIYHTNQYHYVVKWFRGGFTDIFPQIKDYKFKAKTGNESLIKQIYKVLKAKPETKILYRT